jgi:hypothetical protein
MFRAAILTVFAGVAMLSGGSDFGPVVSPTKDTVTATLSYQETGQSVINWSLYVTPQTTPFKKEPPVSPSHLVRGVLNFGDGPSNAIPFLWQRDAGKLFLDLNRNQDLTDDPAGAFSTGLRAPLSYQTFTNVHLAFNTAQGRIQVSADLNFWDYGDRPGGSMSVRSYWQGKVTLQGQDWQVGVIPTIGSGIKGNKNISIETGHLLLRPWENREQAFNAYGGSLDTVPFSQKLFFGGHAYQLNLQTGSADGEFRPALDFLEQPAALGDLKITGKYIKRLMLPGNNYLAILDHPAGTVKVPAGNYKQPSVLLEKGGIEASSTADPWQSDTKIVVTADGKVPAVLDLGGPLTNSVAVARHGRDLRLDYRLIGAGGVTYQLVAQDRSQPPEFAVYRGDKQIASGKFEFG